MTIASKFFYCRRTSSSRPIGRSSEEQEPHLSEADRDAARRARLFRDHRSNHENHCASSKRRPDSSSRAARKLQESSGLNKSASEVEGNSRIDWRASSGVVQLPGVIGDKLANRLPGPVLQARTRLLEKLSSCHLTGGRQEISAINISNCDLYDKCIEWKIATECNLVESIAQAAEVVFKTDQTVAFHDAKKKPCGVSHCVEEDVVISSESDGIASVFLECSICLESFFEGEILNRLHCGHTYHPACLQSWMEVHGVCPYCRASAVD